MTQDAAKDALERTPEYARFHVPMSDAEEAQLVERLKRRDEAAFNALVLAYRTKVYHLVLRMLGDKGEAEDMAQEVFITVFKSIDGFRGDSKLSTWIYRVAANHCKNRIKYLGRRTRGGRPELNEITEKEAVESGSMTTSAHIARPDEEIVARQTESIVQRALAMLDADQKQLVILRDIEGLTYDEIQGVTGLPEGTVKSRLHRARGALTGYVRALQQGKDPSGTNEDAIEEEP